MEIIISNNANKPIYEQITTQIKAMIMSGELQAAANIGRVSNIPLSKLTELLTMFYMEDE